MSLSQENAARIQTAGMLLITVATGAAFWVGQGVEAAVVPFLALLALTAVVEFGRRRNDAVAVMSGVGDERTRALYGRAVAYAGHVLSLVIPAWWLVTVAMGRPNETLAVLATVFGVSFLLATFVLSRRG